MLVLSRRKDEWIEIEISREEALSILDECGKIHIDVMVVEVQRDKARLGFTADRRIRLHRNENSPEVRMALDRRGQRKPVLQGGVAQ